MKPTLEPIVKGLRILIWSALMVVASGGACIKLARLSRARCERNAAEFMDHLQHEDWAWLSRRLDYSPSLEIARLRELRAHYGPIQSWSIDHWYGYAFPNSGGVEFKVTRRGVTQSSSLQMITSNPPRLLGYHESR